LVANTRRLTRIVFKPTGFVRQTSACIVRPRSYDCATCHNKRVVICRSALFTRRFTLVSLTLLNRHQSAIRVYRDTRDGPCRLIMQTRGSQMRARETRGRDNKNVASGLPDIRSGLKKYPTASCRRHGRKPVLSSDRPCLRDNPVGGDTGNSSPQYRLSACVLMHACTYSI